MVLHNTTLVTSIIKEKLNNIYKSKRLTRIKEIYV